METEILNWWLEKYSPQIVNYINTVVQFEEMSAEALEKRRKHLLLEFLDASDSSLLPYILEHTKDFLDRLYDSVYQRDLQNMIYDSL